MSVRSQQLDFTQKFYNLTVWNEKLTLRLVFPAQLLLDYFKEFETNTVTHSAAQTFRNNRSAAISCLAPCGSGKWKVPIFILGLYRKRRWNVGQRCWGSNPLISADMVKRSVWRWLPGRGVEGFSRWRIVEGETWCDPGVAFGLGRVDFFPVPRCFTVICGLKIKGVSSSVTCLPGRVATAWLCL